MTEKTIQWNEYVPVNDGESSVLVGTTTQSLPTTPAAVVGPTPSLNHAWDRFTTFLLPLGLAAAFCGPVSETMRRRVRTSGSTQAPFVVFGDLFQDQWQLHVELVRPEDVRELERLWGLPYPGPYEGDFRIAG
jgi:hypothetical protein